MIYLVDEDYVQRNTLAPIHSNYPCSTEDCEGVGKGLRIKQPPRRIDTEAPSNSNLLQKQHWQKEF